MNMNKLEWRAIVGYEGIYEVSNDGFVRSLKRKFGNGVYTDTTSQDILNLNLSEEEYKKFLSKGIKLD